ncbi:MAG: site-specific DNA-methyltransferase [Candidatus Sungbacteria bacterium]|nr:site-specific DNA-methyltransferase [Candidatus Sungbacteria bacterium]
MQDFSQKLETLLKTDKRFLDADGELLKSEVMDKAYKADKGLVELLLLRPEIKKKFFAQIQEHWIFNINDFVAYIQDKHFLNDSYTKFKNKIGLTIGGKFLNERKEVALVWPFKDGVLEGGMTKDSEKRKEIFFNEILAHDDIDKLFAPKVLTNWKRYTPSRVIPAKAGIQLRRDTDGTIRENLIIKGNNLLALHTLKTQFQQKVKLIYIDPPYNTGNDSFGYNDNFNHSTWLTFMKNRLEAARALLRDDGSIWINIDDTESHYLKVLCDEVFGRDNFVANVVWEKKYSPQNDSKWLSDSHDHILLYAKNKSTWRPYLLSRTEKANAAYRNLDNDPRGSWMSDNPSVKTYSKATDYPITTPSGKIINPPKSRSWRFTKEKFDELVKDNRIWFGKNGDGFPRLKTFLSEVQGGLVSKTLWFRSEVGDNQESKREVHDILDENFSTPKPERLLQRIFEIGSKEGDIVLDFFAGSGTSGAVAMKMKRQFILCEQMDYVEKVTIERLKKALAGEQGGISEAVGWKGGGDFVYCELMKYNERFIDEIEKAKDTKMLLKIWQEMKEKSFFNYSVDLKAFEEHIAEFKELPLKKQKSILLQTLNKNQLYVNASEIDDTEFKVAKEDKEMNKEFYG